MKINYSPTSSGLNNRRLLSPNIPKPQIIDKNPLPTKAKGPTIQEKIHKQLPKGINVKQVASAAKDLFGKAPTLQIRRMK